jgi:hypothetical protein
MSIGNRLSGGIRDRLVIGTGFEMSSWGVQVFEPVHPGLKLKRPLINLIFWTFGTEDITLFRPDWRKHAARAIIAV